MYWYVVGVYGIYGIYNMYGGMYGVSCIICIWCGGPVYLVCVMYGVYKDKCLNMYFFGSSHTFYHFLCICMYFVSQLYVRLCEYMFVNDHVNTFLSTFLVTVFPISCIWWSFSVNTKKNIQYLTPFSMQIVQYGNVAIISRERDSGLWIRGGCERDEPVREPEIESALRLRVHEVAKKKKSSVIFSRFLQSILDICFLPLPWKRSLLKGEFERLLKWLSFCLMTLVEYHEGHDLNGSRHSMRSSTPLSMMPVFSMASSPPHLASVGVNVSSTVNILSYLT